MLLKPRPRSQRAASLTLVVEVSAVTQHQLLLLSQEFQDLYHTVHADPSARAKVPILQDGDLTLIESSLTVRDWPPASRFMVYNRLVATHCRPSSRDRPGMLPMMTMHIGGQVRPISAPQVDYLDKKFPSAGTRLYPDDPAVRFKVLAARALFDSPRCQSPSCAMMTCANRGQWSYRARRCNCLRTRSRSSCRT